MRVSHGLTRGHLYDVMLMERRLVKLQLATAASDKYFIQYQYQLLLRCCNCNAEIDTMNRLHTV